MEVTRLVCGIFQTNTYILEIDNKIIVVDPACKVDKLLPYLNGKELLAVLLTHGHFDHIKACDDLYKMFKVPIYIHEADIEMTKNKGWGRVFGLQAVPTISVPLIKLKETKYKIGPFNFEVIFTPGHSKGSVCYLFDECIFTGDTLFKLACGRCDLEGGDISEMKSSIRLLKSLNPSLIVYPGHDEISDLEYEIENNSYLV